MLNLPSCIRKIIFFLEWSPWVSSDSLAQLLSKKLRSPWPTTELFTGKAGWVCWPGLQQWCRKTKMKGTWAGAVWRPPAPSRRLTTSVGPDTLWDEGPALQIPGYPKMQHPSADHHQGPPSAEAWMPPATKSHQNPHLYPLPPKR